MPDAQAGDDDSAAVEGLHARLRAAAPVPLDLELRGALGHMWALVGASGAGKSTALRCIAGLHRPAHGDLPQHWPSYCYLCAT